MKLHTITDTRGSLTVLEKLPFEIKRVYYLHHVDPSAKRGGHAHRALHRLMVAVNGSFEVTVLNRDGERTVSLDDPSVGLLIAPLDWLVLDNFSADAVCMVLASLEHDEADCIRDFAEYKGLI
jgi:hypothetical protein